MSNGQRNDQKVLRERQEFHLKEAEKFLKIAGARVDGVSDTNRSRAQVHATLATAYGTVHIDEEAPEYGTAPQGTVQAVQDTAVRDAPAVMPSTLYMNYTDIESNVEASEFIRYCTPPGYRVLNFDTEEAEFERI